MSGVKLPTQFLGQPVSGAIARLRSQKRGERYRPLFPINPDGLNEVAERLLRESDEHRSTNESRAPTNFELHREWIIRRAIKQRRDSTSNSSATELMPMHIVEMEEIMEDALRGAVAKHFPLDWKEDPVTHALLIRLRDAFRHVTVYGLHFPIDLQWEIYKFHGSRETAYGDIGLLILCRIPTGSVIEGAGFLEAKIRGRDTTKFLQVRHEQVSRLLLRSPQTRLLLYDYNAVSVLDGSGTEEWEYFPHPFARRRGIYARVTHGPILPLQLAATINQYDDTLYRFSHAFSHQFSRRYFHLHDLDFSEHAVRAVKGFPGELGSPNVIMVIRTAPQGQELPEPFVPNQQTLSSDRVAGGLSLSANPQGGLKYSEQNL